MGVRCLWSILSPYGRKVSLVELQDKLIALDLSCWLCPNQILLEKYQSFKPNLYLRNIFSRIATLLMFNVTPLFILDGKPPDIKKQTLHMRYKTRFKNKGGIAMELDDQKESCRKKHSHALSECKKMISILGLTCVTSSGEGEALCAQLDKEMVVDGVITEDSDAFLYGARKVYRNFSAQRGCGSFEVFQMADIEKHLNMSREKLVALSLLCGSDYDATGVHGFGPQKSLKYLSCFEGDIFQRFNSLKSDEKLQKYEAEKENHKKRRGRHDDACAKCQDGSDPSYHCLGDEDKMMVDFELKLMKEIASNSQFPNDAVIDEYLNFHQEISEIGFTWTEPKIEDFINFMNFKCGWCSCTGFGKIIPLYCRWSLLNIDFHRFEPKKILKKRISKGIRSFDVLWTCRDGSLKSLKCRFHQKPLVSDGVVTTEPEGIILRNCKRLFEEYVENEKPEKKKSKITRQRKNRNYTVDDLIKGIDELSLKKSPFVDCYTIEYEDLNNKNEPKSKYCEDRLPSDYDSTCSTDSYDIDDYKIDESLILNDIISRREYY